jgi:hypothetical protein
MADLPVWQDENVQYPNRYTKTENGDGTIDLVPYPGQTLQEGTPLNAANLQRINAAINAASCAATIVIAAADTVNPRADYVCTGTGDEQVILTMINAIPNGKPSKIVFSPGTYHINADNVSTLQIQGGSANLFNFPNNCYAEGYGATFEISANTTFTQGAIVNLNNSKFKGFAFVRKSGETTAKNGDNFQYGIYATNAVIEDVSLNNSVTWSSFIESHSSIGRNICIDGGTEYCEVGIWSSRSRFENCTIKNITNGAGSLADGIDLNDLYASVTNCYLENCLGIKVDNGDDNYSFSLVQNNTLKACYFILIGEDWGSKIIGNVFMDCMDISIQVASNSKGTIVSGNRFTYTNPSTSGIYAHADIEFDGGFGIVSNNITDSVTDTPFLISGPDIIAENNIRSYELD